MMLRQFLFLRRLSFSPPKLKRRQGSELAIKEKIAKSDIDYKKKHLPPVVPIWKNMTVAELSRSMGKSLDHTFEVMIYVANTNPYESPNSRIDDLQVIKEIVKKSGLRSIVSSANESEAETKVTSTEHLELTPRPVVESELRKRDPVVTIMGHVDHGKTTLLDHLRSSNVAGGEAGGITQHIGAFRVKVGQQNITFLDTPGHAAFSALRNRGAKATDMVILVVAADDGVMEQTKESIRMAREANVPFIVAINKIDKSNADVDRAKAMLLQEGIQLEEFGGDVQSVGISALKGTNVDLLMDVVNLQAEILNLKAEYTGKVEGVVLESRIDQGRGKLCSGLVERGTLRKSAILVAGQAWAKVRALFDENGTILQSAGPSTPVEIIGWRNELPSPGDKIYEVDSEKLAKEIVAHREGIAQGQKQEEDAIAIQAKTEEHLAEYKQILLQKRLLRRRKLRPTGPRQKEILPDSDPTPKLNLIIKGDVDGSVEAFLDLLDSYDCEYQCRINIVHYGVGPMSENDLKLAEMFNGLIYLFGVGVPEPLRAKAAAIGAKIRSSRVIYRLVEELKKDIEGALPLVDKEEEIGVGNVLQQFEIGDGRKTVKVAGVRCTKGQLLKGEGFRLKRGDGEVVFEGKATSMRHLKAEVNEIKNGVECGIQLGEGDVEVKPGDTLICYKTVKESQKCDWDPGF